MKTARTSYPSDVPDEEWALAAPYLTLLREGAGQREHSLREVFNGLRYVVKTGAPLRSRQAAPVPAGTDDRLCRSWRWMPHDLPPLRRNPPAGCQRS